MRHSSLAYQVSGTPVQGTIIAFHGVTDSAPSLSDLADHYGNDWQVITCDHLGHGLSPRLTKDELSDPFAALVDAAIDTVYSIASRTPHKQVILMGHSLGGAVATRVALAMPEVVSGLVLEDPALLTAEQEETYRLGAEQLAKRQNNVRDYPAEAISSLQKAYPTWPATEYSSWAQGKAQVDLNFVRTGVVGTVGRELLKELTVPTLLVTGDADDVLFDADGLRTIASYKNPMLEVEKIANATHTVRRDQRAAFYGIVDPFVRKHAPIEAYRAPYIDPELAPLIPLVPEQTTWDPEAMRSEGERLLAEPTAVPEGITVTVVNVEGIENRVIASATAEPSRIMIAFHGGGFVAGKACYDDARNIEIVTRFPGTIVIAPDYRLAPEHPFPAPVDDCLASIAWAAHTYSLPIFLYGDSAGSGLIHQLLTRITPELLARVNGIIALEPCIDPRVASNSYQRFRTGPIWGRDAASAAWKGYLGEHSKLDVTPLGLWREDLPPFLIFINPADPLRDEGAQWAFDLVDSGARVSLHMLPGTFHGSLSVPETEVWNRVKNSINTFITTRNSHE